MKPKIIGISSSPRGEKSFSRILLDIALSSASKLDAEVEVIDIYNIPIRPCMGCYSDNPEDCNPRRCTSGELEDGMKGIFDNLLLADGIILSTPVYWFGMSGVMKNFVDRLTALENAGKLLDGKVGGVIASAEEEGAISTLMHMASILIDMGLVMPPYSLVYHTGKKSPLEDELTLRDAKRLGINVVRLVKLLKNKDFTFFDF